MATGRRSNISKLLVSYSATAWRLCALLLVGGCLIVAGMPAVSRAQPDPQVDASQQSTGEVVTSKSELVLPKNLTDSLSLVLDKLRKDTWWKDVNIWGLVGALLGAMIAYRGALAAAERAYTYQRKMLIETERLRRVNAQLNEFYGPLYALDSAGVALWKDFCEHYERCPSDNIARSSEYSFLTHNSEHGSIEKQCQKNIDFLKVYMRVMKHVFEPLNAKREELVLAKADLVEEPASGQNSDRLPKVLIDLVAHVSELRSVMRRWNDLTCNGDSAEKIDGEIRKILERQDPDWKEFFAPRFNFPAGLHDYAKLHFNQLSERKTNVERGGSGWLDSGAHSLSGRLADC